MSAMPAEPRSTKARLVGRIELRLTLAVAIMAAAPLVIGIYLAVRLARTSSELFFDPRVGRELETALELYGPLVRAIKADMVHRAEAIAAREPLRAAAALRDDKEVAVELQDAFDRYSDRPEPLTGDAPLVSLVSLEVYVDLPFETCLEQFAVGPPSVRINRKGAPMASSASPSATGLVPKISVSGVPRSVGPNVPAIGKYTRLGRVAREAPVDPQTDHVLAQCRPLGGDGGDGGNHAMLLATFSTSRARIDHVQEASDIVDVYKQVVLRREEWIRLNIAFFSALLFLTVLLSASAGFVFARGVTKRVRRVSDAARRVALGDLEVRVPEQGADEVSDLAEAFNRMVGEVAQSRARVEYLQRMGAWQDMARRLAHEIKNPLTPIQLAVEECHARYQGDDPRMRKLLDTTLEIVREEIGTLHRLVSEFSEFARLPKAQLEPLDVRTLLAEIKPTMERLGLGTDQADVLRLTPSGGHAIPVRVTVEAAGEPAQIAADRQMLRKAIDNLVRNAVQAIRAKGQGYRVVVKATQIEGQRVAIDVEDDGPGVPEASRLRIFDPYFTTRTEGTGLGLAIVKKIVIEHGGTITCEVATTLGDKPVPDVASAGARFRIVLPSLESPEARAALEESKRSPTTLE